MQLTPECSDHFISLWSYNLETLLAGTAGGIPMLMATGCSGTVGVWYVNFLDN